LLDYRFAIRALPTRHKVAADGISFIASFPGWVLFCIH
jgi:hypothetical protein